MTNGGARLKPLWSPHLQQRLVTSRAPCMLAIIINADPGAQAASPSVSSRGSQSPWPPVPLPGHAWCGGSGTAPAEQRCPSLPLMQAEGAKWGERLWVSRALQRRTFCSGSHGVVKQLFTPGSRSWDESDLVSSWRTSQSTERLSDLEIISLRESPTSFLNCPGSCSY